MLDTNIVIYTVKIKPEAVRQQFTAHEGEMSRSNVTAMKMLYGAHKAQSVRYNWM
jgi:tRNA(fMet)-specific endonuclease VapC